MDPNYKKITLAAERIAGITNDYVATNVGPGIETKATADDAIALMLDIMESAERGEYPTWKHAHGTALYAQEHETYVYTALSVFVGENVALFMPEDYVNDHNEYLRLKQRGKMARGTTKLRNGMDYEMLDLKGKAYQATFCSDTGDALMRPNYELRVGPYDKVWVHGDDFACNYRNLAYCVGRRYDTVICSVRATRKH